MVVHILLGHYFVTPPPRSVPLPIRTVPESVVRPVMLCEEVLRISEPDSLQRILERIKKTKIKVLTLLTVLSMVR